MGIGNKLNDLLKQNDMTVTELSRRVNVAPTTIYSIIQRNNKKVDIDVLLDIADVLGVVSVTVTVTFPAAPAVAFAVKVPLVFARLMVSPTFAVASVSNAST